jgi:hypothetical protein
MIENYDYFSKWNGNFGKTYDILGKLYVFFKTCYKRFHQKIASYEKMKRI